MRDSESWDWQARKRVVTKLADVLGGFSRVDELAVSPDGETLAAVGKTPDDDFAVCLNGKVWPDKYELAWYLRYSLSGNLIVLARIEDEWTVVKNGVSWENRFEYAWNPVFGADGDTVGTAYKREFLYGVAIDDKPWEEGKQAMRDFCLSPDGRSAAATIQLEALKEADVSGFFEGNWSLAVDGRVWNNKFINVWNPVFSENGKSVAAEVRTSNTEYSIAVNGETWPERFGGVWPPAFHPDGSVFAPVRHEGSWRLFRDGKPAWDGRYNQMWHQRVAPGGHRVAAVVSPEFGKWTIAVDDKPWDRKFPEMVLAPLFSPDGKRVAALVKENDLWAIAVDGLVTGDFYDMVWAPTFSPCGRHVLAKARTNDGLFVLVDGKQAGNHAGKPYERLWDPAFSPDGKSVLLRYIEDGNYCRQVLPVEELRG